jgi:hypothetical protein
MTHLGNPVDSYQVFKEQPSGRTTRWALLESVAESGRDSGKASQAARTDEAPAKVAELVAQLVSLSKAPEVQPNSQREERSSTPSAVAAVTTSQSPRTPSEAPRFATLFRSPDALPETAKPSPSNSLKRLLKDIGSCR